MGGAAVRLWNAAGSQDRRALTTGDGAFRFVNIPPGTYDLRVTLNGFEAFDRAGIQLRAGDVFSIEPVLKPLMVPLPTRNYAPPQPAYRMLADASSAPPPGEAVPFQPPPPADQVFIPMKNRWNYDFEPYHRYAPPAEVPYVKGHFYDPFNKSKLKGDQPIFGRTFFNLTLTSDTFLDGRKIPTPSGVYTANPQSSNFFGSFGQGALNQDFSFQPTCSTATHRSARSTGACA